MNDLELAELGLERLLRWERMVRPLPRKQPAAPEPEPALQTQATAAPAPVPTPATQAQPAAADALQADPVPAPSPAADDSLAGCSLEQLAAAAAACSKCGLCKGRQQAVVGTGDPAPGGILFVGEGPGKEEDIKGEPFVGPAGRLLDSMLAAISLRRGEKLYIANVVKCRPPNNRTPHQDEIAACLPYLQRQIELLQPRLIVALGTVAGNALLGKHDGRMFEMRGRPHMYHGIPLFVTYHPSYYLHRPEEKIKGWEDLVALRKLAAG